MLTAEWLLPQSHPALRNHDGISRILRIITYGRWQAEAAGMQIDELPQIGHVLRGLVGYASHVVMENQKSGRFASVGLHLLNVDDSSISNAADAVEPRPPFSLHLVGALGFATQQQIRGQQGARAPDDHGIETNWNHNLWKEMRGKQSQRLKQNKARGRMTEEDS